MMSLYFSPGACSRVTLIALNEVDARVETHLVKFARGDHRSAEYLKLNPKGQVPTLVADGRPVTENVAILTWLDKLSGVSE
jgi:glutathione S-transferase